MPRRQGTKSCSTKRSDCNKQVNRQTDETHAVLRLWLEHHGINSIQGFTARLFSALLKCAPCFSSPDYVMIRAWERVSGLLASAVLRLIFYLIYHFITLNNNRCRVHHLRVSTQCCPLRQSKPIDSKASSRPRQDVNVFPFKTPIMQAMDQSMVMKPLYDAHNSPPENDCSPEMSRP